MATTTDASSSLHSGTIPPPLNTSHPAFAINIDIRNFIPVRLYQDKELYELWVELFHNHACAYDVLDHIDASVPRPPLVDASTWKRIDAILKQWIYGSISKEVLTTIIKPRGTAQELWTRIEEIFQDIPKVKSLGPNLPKKEVYANETVVIAPNAWISNAFEVCDDYELEESAPNLSLCINDLVGNFN
ncbi:hypothetical protein OSB04_012297 [Centaurea solstitialis]|uniref:Uncharacterized protein n=1 Tax=Centaurea solstitialis TaxID=347529 RepID=A0AA38TB51_9ASTR|nr:hypothetical protein OSB04_012297 [Centaurea solstitialis]